MKIIKRNGAEATFDISKIIMAVTKANAAVEEGDRMTPRQIQRIAESVELACQELGRSDLQPGRNSGNAGRDRKSVV